MKHTSDCSKMKYPIGIRGKMCCSCWISKGRRIKSIDSEISFHQNMVGDLEAIERKYVQGLISRREAIKTLNSLCGTKYR